MAKISLRYVLLFCLLLPIPLSWANDRLQPFILASESAGELTSTVETVKKTLESTGFQIVGSHQPYAGSEIIVVTNEQLKANSRQSERGGYGAVVRVAITNLDGKNEVSFTNPIYWANAYRMKDSLQDTQSKLKSALGYIKEFGSGDKKLTAKDLRHYHYTLMMEYFDDPSDLNSFDSHAEAVQTIERNLASHKGAASKVYSLALGKDSDGKEMTLVGVALNGKDREDCSGDQYIMSRIDKSTPRHTAHLPYEILIYGNKAEALYARFRIAISWPHLPMMRSETGATFFSIMCAPGAIESALEEVAGKD